VRRIVASSLEGALPALLFERNELRPTLSRRQKHEARYSDIRFSNTTSLGYGVPVLVHDRVLAPDGSTWYGIDAGYLPARSVRLPREPTRTFVGRWLDADLQEPAMLTDRGHRQRQR
jgi:hypothetical protein